MFVQRIRAAGSFAFLIAACLCVLPACKKKKSSSDSPESSPPPGYPGAKDGPPGNPQQSLNNLKQIGRACHNYHDYMNGLPHAIADANGKPGLSWRVALLPFLEQEALYKQFKLTEPWDSEHNKKLIARMPAVYATFGGASDGKTYYRSFTGAGTIMPPAQAAQPGKAFRGLSLANVPDGTANTFMVVEASEAVIWTKPDELPFTPGKPPPRLGSGSSDGFFALMVDGSVKKIRSKIDARTLSNAIQTNDGQIVELD
jgi:hypothetical protein